MRTKVNVCAVFLPISLNYYPFLSVFAHEAHTKTRGECTRMAVIVKLPLARGAFKCGARKFTQAKPSYGILMPLRGH